MERAAQAQRAAAQRSSQAEQQVAQARQAEAAAQQRQLHLEHTLTHQVCTTYTHTDLLTHSCTHSLSHAIHWLARSNTHSFTFSLTTHPLRHSLFHHTHTLTRWLKSLTNSLTHVLRLHRCQPALVHTCLDRCLPTTCFLGRFPVTHMRLDGFLSDKDSSRLSGKILTTPLFMHVFKPSKDGCMPQDCCEYAHPD